MSCTVTSRGKADMFQAEEKHGKVVGNQSREITEKSDLVELVRHKRQSK